MTTLRDILRDFAKDVLDMQDGNTNLGDLSHDSGCTCAECIENLIDVYTS